MKKTLTLIAALLLTAATGIAQTINVHKTDGTVISYPAATVDYVDFSTSSTDNVPDGVEAVDLGLPSGTKWANMNIGASRPEESGDYFRWAETTPFIEGDTYESYPYNGVDLGESIAGTKYDAATANWGTSWMMPTVYQMQELIDNCTFIRTTQNGVNGAKFTGPNGASIFFPASGCRSNSSGSLSYVGSIGYYWSASVYKGSYGHGLTFGSGYWRWSDFLRAYGFPVRAVAR